MFGLEIDQVATIFSTAVAMVSLLYTLLATHRNERDLERLRAEFAEKQADRDARRDYEYEARKRLYTEFEPLFFQFFEAARAARGQMYGLASAARRGNLDPEVSWLAKPDAYYTLSLTYNIFAPLALGRLIQRRLTFVDLTLDPRISSQYEAIRRVSRVLSHDYGLSTAEPRLLYDPNHADAEQLKVTQPEAYRRQGVFAGYLDMLLESFLVGAPDAQQRLLSFGEFVRMQEENHEAFMRRFGRAIDLFLYFHPRTRPVLWRILIVQCAIYRWIRNSVDGPLPTLTPQALHEPKTERHELDWRMPGDTTPDSQSLVDPFSAVEAYFAKGFAN